MINLQVKDKKITLMGLGALGRGVGVAEFLLAQGARLVITDLKSAAALSASIERLRPYEANIEYVLERHRLQDFSEVDLVVKAAGVPLNDKYVQAAREKGIEVKMDASWFTSLLPADVITVGVTGTKGKSSVTHLIHHILRTAGCTSYLGGNIRGQATLPLIEKVKAGDLVVMELDSWQLQGFHDEKLSPRLAVFTNFMPDHLNYYKGMPEYFYDKSAIYRYQSKKDWLVLSPSSFEAMRKYDSDFKPQATTAIAKSALLPKNWPYTQPGMHNRLNAAQAYQAAKFLGIDDEAIKEALQTFGGIEGRLQLVTERCGVGFYNDTNATTPEAVIASVTALRESGRQIILITGGVNKGLDYDDYIRVLNESVAEVLIFSGGVADLVIPKLKIPYQVVEKMSVAVQAAAAAAQAGDVVLMSPGASSFGHFMNEYDRGDQFNQAVRDLKSS